MIIEAPEQQVAVLGADAIRSQMGRMSNTPPARIFVYQTRTINGAGGQPNTAVRCTPGVLAEWLLLVSQCQSGV
jgi:hypothetical protein